MQDFLESTKNLESPQSYFYWSILTAVSSVVGKRVWISRGGVYNLYPNVYTFLISKRSGLRKGVPINVAKKLVHETGKVRMIDGQNSIQGVIKELGRVRTVGNGHVIKSAEGFLISGEFASFLITDGIGSSLTTLTDLYDAQYHEQGFKKKLATQDEIELKDPCLTALFASNETHFFNSVPKNAISGGFLARTFCVYEERRHTYNSLTGANKPIPEKLDYTRGIQQLIQLSNLNGQMITEPDALKIYDEWYYPFSETDHEEEDETGTSERIGDNIWKLAMLISLINNHELIITVSDMKEAIEKGMETFNSLKRLLLGGTGGGSDNKDLKGITMRTVIAMILETEPNFEVERKKILRKGAGVFGVYDLDACIEHLLQAGMIKIDKRGQGQYYKLTSAAIKRHLGIKKEKEEDNGEHGDGDGEYVN